ncbi:MAG: PLAT/LH2 domain-containing protein [Candidatus Thorarchaeota archaeon]
MNNIKYEKINSITLEITTGTQRRSSTDDRIELYIGSHKWLLDIQNHDDFEKGKTDVYKLDVPKGMDSSWFRYLCLKKISKSVSDDDWLLDKIKLTINGNLIYEKAKINHWLKDNETSWCAPDFKYGNAKD